MHHSNDIIACVTESTIVASDSQFKNTFVQDQVARERPGEGMGSGVNPQNTKDGRASTVVVVGWC